MAYKWDLFKDGVTQTQILKFLECKRKFYFSLMRGWSEEFLSDAILFGILFHECMDRYYTGDMNGVPDQIARVVVTEQEKKLSVDSWPRARRQSWEFLVAQCYGIFSPYCKWYEEDDKKLDWISVEGVFKVPVTIRLSDGQKVTIPVTGKRDGLVAVRTKSKKSSLMVMEHKTKSRVNMGGINNTLSNDFQVNLYSWAANKERTNKDGRYQGVIYNLIRRPQLRLSVTESLPKHTARVDAAVRKAGAEYFTRLRAPIGKKQEEKFEKVLKGILREIAEFVLFDKGESHDRFSPPCLGPWGQCSLLGICYNGDSAGLKRRDVPFEELV